MHSIKPLAYKHHDIAYNLTSRQLTDLAKEGHPVHLRFPERRLNHDCCYPSTSLRGRAIKHLFLDTVYFAGREVCRIVLLAARILYTLAVSLGAIFSKECRARFIKAWATLFTSIFRAVVVFPIQLLLNIIGSIVQIIHPRTGIKIRAKAHVWDWNLDFFEARNDPDLNVHSKIPRRPSTPSGSESEEAHQVAEDADLDTGSPHESNGAPNLLWRFIEDNKVFMYGLQDMMGARRRTVQESMQQTPFTSIDCDAL